MTPTPVQGADCGSEYGADGRANAPAYLCTRPVGHPGAHYDATVGTTWTADDPPAGLLPRVDELTARIRELSAKFRGLERCGQRHISSATKGAPAVSYTCTLAAGHHGDFHMDMEAQATWSHAGDLELHATNNQADARCRQTGPASLQHDACGALLSFQLHNCQPVTLRCALGGPTHPGMRHRASDGTQWDTATPVTPGAGLSESARRAVIELDHQASGISALLRELRNALCTGCQPAGPNPEQRQDCPVHGEVAELRRSLDWATRQHERIAAALGPEYLAPFGPDTAQAAVQCIETARGVDAVLREAGIEYPLGLRGVEDLANLHSGALEHVAELRAAVRAEIVATVHQGHSAELDGCTHHQCMALRKAAAA